MKSAHFDSCIIGAGAIGLAVARQLALSGQKVVVLEKTNCFGSGISSRNSEVIHAGLYYPPNTLKAHLCVTGRHKLYSFCQRYSIPHRQTGKLIVAHSKEQTRALHSLQTNASANDVPDLQLLDARQLQSIEPLVTGYAALLSPSTGIIDSHAFMSALVYDIQQQQGLLSLHTEFLSATYKNDHFNVNVLSVNEPYEFNCTHLINAAGLSAHQVAATIQNPIEPTIPALYYCKGSYFSYPGTAPFAHLIYPLPEPDTTGLGIHATLDMAGQVRFGPDTEYVASINYHVEASRKTQFTNAIQRYFPSLDTERLVPAYAGIRPKLQGPSQTPCDFTIDIHDSGLVNLYGIESPGLTSALAIAEHIANGLLEG